MKRRPRALYEGRWIFLILGLCWVTLLFFHALIPGVFVAALILFCVNFFRDPERIPPPDPALAVAPADGTVTLVDECVEEQYLKCRMKRISIFLSVFDVHVNRTPVALSGCAPSGGLPAERKPALDHRIERGSRPGSGSEADYRGDCPPHRSMGRRG